MQEEHGPILRERAGCGKGAERSPAPIRPGLGRRAIERRLRLVSLRLATSTQQGGSGLRPAHRLPARNRHGSAAPNPSVRAHRPSSRRAWSPQAGSYACASLGRQGCVSDAFARPQACQPSVGRPELLTRAHDMHAYAMPAARSWPPARSAGGVCRPIPARAGMPLVARPRPAPDAPPDPPQRRDRRCANSALLAASPQRRACLVVRFLLAQACRWLLRPDWHPARLPIRPSG